MASSRPSNATNARSSEDVGLLAQRGVEVPRLTRDEVPERYREHHLLKGKLFYSLPQGLLDRVVDIMRTANFDQELLAMERELTAVTRPPAIGFWNGRVIRSSWLAPLPPMESMDFSEMEDLGWSDDEKQSVVASLVELNQKLEAMRTTLAGYAGWLLTNKTFLGEHDQLLHRHAEFIERRGLPRMGTIGPGASQETRDELGLTAPNAEEDAVLKEFASFNIRWRLENLDGPYAPNPLTPQLPVRHLPSVSGHMQEGGQTFYFPDVYPIPSRDELRTLIEENLRPASASPDYLQEWLGIVNSSQTAKNQIARFARLFSLQHCVRSLYARHGETLQGAKTHLQTALGEHFKVSADAIKDDMAFIAERLGSGWEESPRAY